MKLNNTKTFGNLHGLMRVINYNYLPWSCLFIMLAEVHELQSF
jgi:hypothetical protein